MFQGACAFVGAVVLDFCRAAGRMMLLFIDTLSKLREVNQADRNNDIIVEFAPDHRQKAAREEEEEESLAALLKGGRNKQSVAIDYIVDGEQKVTVRLP